ERLDGLAFTRAPGDVRDRDSLRAGMRACDATIHLAAPSSWAGDDPSTLTDTIIGGARNVLDVAAELRGHRVVIISSSAAINASDTPLVFDETAEFTITDPALVYAHAKHG